MDPRVVDLFHDGVTIAPVLAQLPNRDGGDDEAHERIERAVLDLLETGDEPH